MILYLKTPILRLRDKIPLPSKASRCKSAQHAQSVCSAKGRCYINAALRPERPLYHSPGRSASGGLGMNKTRM